MYSNCEKTETLYHIYYDCQAKDKHQLLLETRIYL